MERIKVYSCGLQDEHSIYDHLICFKRKIWNCEEIDLLGSIRLSNIDYTALLRGYYSIDDATYQIMTNANIPIYIEIYEGHLKNVYLDDRGIQNIDILVEEAGNLLLKISDQEIRSTVRALSVFELNATCDEVEDHLDRMYPFSAKALSRQFGIPLIDAMFVIEESGSNLSDLVALERNQEMEWEV